MSTSSTTSLSSNSTAIQGCPISNLTPDLLFDVESFLTLSELLGTRRVCRAMKEASADNPVYMKYLEIMRLADGGCQRTINLTFHSQLAYDLDNGRVAANFPSFDKRQNRVEVHNINGDNPERFSLAPNSLPIQIDGSNNILTTANCQTNSIEFWDATTGKRLNSISDKGELSGYTNSSTWFFARAAQEKQFRIEFFDLNSLNKKAPEAQFSSVIDWRKDYLWDYDHARGIGLCSNYSLRQCEIWNFSAQKCQGVFKKESEGTYYDRNEGILFAPVVKPAKIVGHNVTTGQAVKVYSLPTTTRGVEKFDYLHIDSVSRKIFACVRLSKQGQGIACWDIGSEQVLTYFPTPYANRFYRGLSANYQIDYEPETQCVFVRGEEAVRIYSFQGKLIRALHFSSEKVHAQCDRFILDKKNLRLFAEIRLFRGSHEPDRFLKILGCPQPPSQTASTSSQQGQEPPKKKQRLEGKEEKKS